MIKVTCKPLASLVLFATLSLSSNATAQILEVLNSDESIAVPDGAAPDKFAGSDFPQTKIGESTAFIFTLTTGGSPNSATIVSVVLSGAHPGDFEVDPPDNLAVGGAENGNRPLGVTFKPVVAGVRTATVTINYTEPAGHSYAFQVRGNGYANLPLASADIAVLEFDLTAKLKKKTNTVVVKGKVTVGNNSAIALEGGSMQVFRSSERAFDSAAILVTTIPLKPLKGKPASGKIPQKKIKFKLDMGDDQGETIFVRIFPVTPTSVDDNWTNNQGADGYGFI